MAPDPRLVRQVVVGEVEDWIGVYMTDDGPINVTREMPKDQMWFVLNKLMGDYNAMRERHTKDWEFLMSLRR